MKSLKHYIKSYKSSLISLSEKLVVNKNYNSIYNYYPKDRDELNIAIQEHYDKGVFDLNDIDVSKITDFSSLFDMDKNTGNKDFNISEWDVSNGEDFSKMFRYCTKLNCDLSKWDVSNGILFNSMFFNCYKFNSDLSNWNVSKGENFSWMFYTCYEFNCDLSKWKIKNTAKTPSMFNNCNIEDKNKPDGVW